MKMIVIASVPIAIGRSGNPFMAGFAIKDRNELLRQFALSGSGAGLAPKNIRTLNNISKITLFLS
jgi:hypothetical protein